MLTPQDRHDLDKLARWREGLDGEQGPFPAYAVFVINEIHQDAYNIFRQYRSAFEDAGAAFHHLVIFGQHGASTASRALANELGLAEPDVPALALVVSGVVPEVYGFALPKGDGGQPLDDAQPWNRALVRIIEAAKTQTELVLEGSEAVLQSPVPGGTVASLAKRISDRLNGGDAPA